MSEKSQKKGRIIALLLMRKQTAVGSRQPVSWWFLISAYQQILPSRAFFEALSTWHCAVRLFLSWPLRINIEVYDVLVLSGRSGRHVNVKENPQTNNNAEIQTCNFSGIDR